MFGTGWFNYWFICLGLVMLNVLNTIYNGKVIGKKKIIPKLAPATIIARARQRCIVTLIKGRLMGTKDIASALGEEGRTVRGDLRSLIERGEIINLSSNKQAYLVRAA